MYPERVKRSTWIFLVNCVILVKEGNMDHQLLQNSINTQVVLTFSRSSGSGGQNVNKVNTKVTASLSLDQLQGVTSAEKEQVLSKLSNRINDKGELIIQVQEERSQLRNRERAEERLFELISQAGRIAKKRRPTKPGRAAKERRLNSKRKTKEKKALRKPASHHD